MRQLTPSTRRPTNHLCFLSLSTIRSLRVKLSSIPKKGASLAIKYSKTTKELAEAIKRNFKKWIQGNWLGEQHRMVAAFKGGKYLKHMLGLSTIKCIFLLKNWKVCCNWLYKFNQSQWCAVQRVKNSWVSEYREQVGATSEICPQGQHKICPIEHGLHFTGPDVLSFPNNSTYFQPNIRVKICEKVWEEVRWNCRNWKTLLRSHFPSLCPWKVWDKSIFFSLQDFIVA